MRKRRGLISFLCACILCFPGCRPLPPPTEAPLRWAVYFSPNGGATEAIVHELEEARHSIRVQAYSFTSAPIAKALVEAERRGVDVEVILDKSNESRHYSAVDFLLHAGIPTRIDDQHAIAHNKVIIVDNEIVITGSFNFTRAAEERNAENLLVIRDPKLARRYTENWEEHANHSRLISASAAETHEDLENQNKQVQEIKIQGKRAIHVLVIRVAALNV